MRNYVRGNLARIAEEKGYNEYVSLIKSYWSIQILLL